MASIDLNGQAFERASPSSSTLPPPPPADRPGHRPSSSSAKQGFSLSLPAPTPSVASSSSANPFDSFQGPWSEASNGSGPSATASAASASSPSNLPSAANPWAHLMASSGAPTPSLKGAFSPFSFGSSGGGISDGPSSGFTHPAAGRPPFTPSSSSYLSATPTLNRSTSSRTPGPGGLMSPDVKAMREMSIGHGETAGIEAALGQPSSSSSSGVGGPPPPTTGGVTQGGFGFPPAGTANFRLPGGPTKLSLGTRVPSGAIGGNGRPVFGSSGATATGPGPTNGSSTISRPTSSTSKNPASSSPSSSSPASIRVIPPSALPTPLPPTYLLLDLRTHALFTNSRVQGAIPVTIPSTLLRRPNFTLAKLIPMLDSEHDRARVLAYKDGAKVDAVVVYDQDGSSAGDNGTLIGLLAKFKKEGFEGELLALKGGFLSLAKQSRPVGQGGLVDDKRVETSFRAGGTVNGRELPANAFQSTSTSGLFGSPSLSHSAGPSTSLSFAPGGTNMHAHTAAPTPGGHLNGSGWDPTSGPSGAGNAAAGAGLRNFTLTPNSNSLQAANPFFDNIRQNTELSHGGITERIPLDLPASTIERASELPTWLRDLAQCSEPDAADRLAAQFESVERGELKRLQGVMSYHARFGGADAGHAGYGGAGEGEGEYFPYSITAGLEKGQKNRFRNIWPFDHARVRLNDHCVDDGSDYINASFIAPRATNKRYIATQGPLPSTFRDFWMVCWEQNVRVIVMLTKQHEGGQVKCGDYWSDSTFGPLKLHPLGVEGPEEPAEEGGGGFSFFAPPPAASTSSPSGSGPSSRSSSFSSVSAPPRPSLIKRTFHLTHIDFPNEPPRLITQLQYVSWPDFDIPDSPSDLLSIIHQVNDLNDTAAAEAANAGTAPPGPTVVHCSAGVGRTGSYVVVDAVLDAVKREMAKKRESKRGRKHSLASSSGAGSGVATPGLSLENLRANVLGTHNVGSPRSTISGSVSPAPPPTPPQARRLPSPFAPGESSPQHPSTLASTFNLDRRPSMDTPAPFVPSGMEVDYAKVLERKASRLADEESAMSESSYDHADGTHHTSSTEIRPVNMSAGPSVYSSPSVHTSGSQVSLGQFGEMNLGRRGSVPSLFSSSSQSLATPQPFGIARESSPSAVTGLPASDVPRNVHRPDAPYQSPTELADIRAPIFNILSDMRQQRMSLCQTLRQYVFVYRVVFQGVLDIIDEERKEVHDLPTEDKKRQASPTNIQHALSKRPSLKLPKAQGRPRRGSTKSGGGVGSNGGSGHSLSTIPSPSVSLGLQGFGQATNGREIDHGALA